MGQYFLIKEQIYTDGAVEKTDISLIGGVSFDARKEASQAAQTYLQYPTDIVYVVGILEKHFGKMKGEKNVKI